MRVLGIDYGAKRVGLALGDTESGIASPWGILERKDDAQVIREILTSAKKEGATMLVIGLPRSLRDPNAQNDQLREVEHFIGMLRASAGDLTVETEDEMMTSVLGGRLAHDAGRSGYSDDLAASTILETWLSRKR